MGKWSQYKRRGSSDKSSSVVLGPPPPPNLILVGGVVIQRHTGTTDSEAICRLYQSSDGLNFFFRAPEVEWAPDVDWGDSGSYPDLWLRCTEVGNGVNYVGESIPSNVLDLT